MGRGYESTRVDVPFAVRIALLHSDRSACPCVFGHLTGDRLRKTAANPPAPRIDRHAARGPGDRPSIQGALEGDVIRRHRSVHRLPRHRTVSRSGIRDNAWSRSLAENRAQAKPDLIISISRGATSFAVRHRAEIAPDIPLIYCCTSTSTADPLDIPADIPGLIVEYDWAGTLALAERLQPNAKTLVVVSGASDRDRAWLEDIDPSPATVPDEVRHQISDWPSLRPAAERSVAPSAQFHRDPDANLRRWLGPVSRRDRCCHRMLRRRLRLRSILPWPRCSVGASSAATWTVYEQQGIKVADFALEILAGKNPSALPHQTKLPLQYRVDARQLERWGFKETYLPPGDLD